MHRAATAALAVLVLLFFLVVGIVFLVAHVVTPDYAPDGRGERDGLATGTVAEDSPQRSRRHAKDGAADSLEEDAVASTPFSRLWPEVGQDVAQDPTLGSISGRVLAAQECPVPEAVVETSVRGEVTARLRVRGDGKFVLKNVPPGMGIALTARAPGHAPGGMEKLVVREAQMLRVGVVYLGAAIDPSVENRLDVLVTTTAGDAVPGASVTATSAYFGSLLALGAWEKQPGGNVFRATTDAAGRVRFDQLPPNSYDVFAEAEGLSFEVQQRYLVQRDTRAEVHLKLQPGLSIEGKVVDPQDQPVSGARVGAMRWGSFTMVPAVATEADGTFAVKGLAPGSYFLFAAKEEFGARDVQNIPAGRKDLVIGMELGGEMALRVVDAAAGAPVTHFTVRPFRKMPFAYLFSPVVEVDAPDGVFRARLPVSDYGVEVSAPGYALRNVPSVPVPSAEPFEIRLDPSGVVHGRVVSRVGGGPIIGAEVFVRRGGFPPTRVKELQTVTDAKGEFVLDGLARTPLSLSISHVDHTEASFDGVEPAPRGPEGEPPPVVEFALGSGGRIEGRVFGADHLPAAGVTMQITSGFDFFAARNTVVDANGTYAFRNVPPGKDYSLSVGTFLPGRAGSSRSDIEIVEGAVVTVDFGTESGGQPVAGRVLLGEEPVANQPVTLAADDGGSTVEQTQSDAQGRFAFAAVPPGRYLVRGTWGRTKAVSVTVTAEEPPAEVILAIVTSALEGKVVDATTGQPLAGVYIECEQVTETSGSNLTSLMRSNRGGRPSSENGTFRISGLDEGRYRLRALRDPYGTEIVDGLEVGPGATLSGIEIRMGAGGTLAGAVRTAAGVPVEGASIHLVDSGGRAVSQISLVTSSSDGSYAVNPALRPGTYDARAEKEGYAPATLRVTIRAGETAPADFTLLRGGRIDVVVVRAGERVEGAMVSLLDADGRPVTRGLTLHNIFSLGRDRTDRDGRITLESVAAGRYTIRAQKGDAVTSPTPVEAIESGTTPIDFALAE